jgi:hypothetical protein
MSSTTAPTPTLALAARADDRVDCRREVPLLAGRPRAAHELDVHDRLAVLEHAPELAAHARVHLRQQLVDGPPEVLFGRHAVHLGQLVVHAPVAQLGVEVREPDRRAREQGVEERERVPLLALGRLQLRDVLEAEDRRAVREGCALHQQRASPVRRVPVQLEVLDRFAACGADARELVVGHAPTLGVGDPEVRGGVALLDRSGREASPGQSAGGGIREADLAGAGLHDRHGRRQQLEQRLKLCPSKPCRAA